MSLFNFLFLLPMAAACLIGMVVALINWSRSSSSSLLTLLGCGAILGSRVVSRAVFYYFATGVQAMPAFVFFFAVVEAIGLGMILAAVFVRLPGPSTTKFPH